MASATTEFSIATAVLTLASQVLCVSEVTQTTSAAGFQYTCMGNAVQSALVSGTYQWGISATVAYGNAGEIDGLRGVAGTYSLVITTSNGQTITQTGNMVVTSVDAGPFSFDELPTATITLLGNGLLSEVNS